MTQVENERFFREKAEGIRKYGAELRARAETLRKRGANELAHEAEKMATLAEALAEEGDRLADQFKEEDLEEDDVVLFENAQWAVNDFGLSSKRPPAPMVYELPADRLLDKTDQGDGEQYDWLRHLAEKTWVNFPLFLEAYQKALELHAGRYTGTVDEAMMDRSIATARRVAAANRR